VKSLHPNDAALLQSFIDRVRAMGVHVEGTRQHGNGLSALPWELVKVTDFALGAGLYYGNMYRGYAADMDSAADLDVTELEGYERTNEGANATAVRCVIANLGESGNSGSHFLAVGRITAGVLLGYTSDHELVIAVDVPPSPVIFPVTVTMTGGSNGTAGTSPTAATYIYTVQQHSTGITLGTGLSPVWGRPFGPVSTGTIGQAYYNAGGSLVLMQVNEIPTLTALDVIDGAAWSEPNFVFTTQHVLVPDGGSGSSINVPFDECEP